MININFPFLKDKTDIIKTLHKDPKLPFNVSRDVLNFPLFTADEIDKVSGVWIRYFGSGDEYDLITQLKEVRSINDFWLMTVKISLTDSLFMDKLITIIKSGSIETFIQQSSIPLSETLVASLINAQRFDTAYYVFRDLLKHSKAVNWEPIFNVCLVSENSHSLKTLMLIHGEVENNFYKRLIPHLFKLKLKDHYIHKWSSVLISYNDFPKDSSAPLNPVFKSILETSNLRSLDNCIPKLAKSIENPEKWLDQETIKLFSQYIIVSKDSEGKLSKVLNTFGTQVFEVEEFWLPFFYKTNIQTSTLKTFMKKCNIDSSRSQNISEALDHRLFKEDPDKFLEAFNSKLDGKASLATFGDSLKLLKIHLQKSDNFEMAYEFAIHMIEKFPRYSEITASTYLTECMKFYKGDQKLRETLLKFENFILENKLLENHSKITGALIYMNLKLSRFGRAIEDIKTLISSDQKIDQRTIHHSYETLKRNHRNIPNELIDKDVSNTNEFILKLVIKMSAKCPNISPITYNILLRDIVWVFNHQDSKLILNEIVDFLKTRQTSNISSNNEAHILKKIFDKELISDIIKKGFRNPKEPWCGITVIKELQEKGVHIEYSRVKRECLNYLDSLSLVTTDRAQNKVPWIKPSIGALPAVDHNLFMSKVNEMIELPNITTSTR
ncbi:hypothetical protein BN7_2064 [Wickerhamomyces ciferrii]|uniref:Uncharacterized protein n=1 Tax=Wickerhamomyces ciferrii (strain ATCC 14091 / BCRC 22168 / CBS 111 / JCM 3599 / NBRC 0793 / NRRL Y-1031 F-60-10) TaxID=1206466 RepID=K0KBS9_WICCF|nr:uncharacterized protein BN7_2064 [Wickerhamomyces ciferrii]CCH42520.1 hypothetical protein BN7_2064 [Wickerhamomyces ciferrii]